VDSVILFDAPLQWSISYTAVVNIVYSSGQYRIQQWSIREGTTWQHHNSFMHALMNIPKPKSMTGMRQQGVF